MCASERLHETHFISQSITALYSSLIRAVNMQEQPFSLQPRCAQLPLSAATLSCDKQAIYSFQNNKIMMSDMRHLILKGEEGAARKKKDMMICSRGLFDSLQPICAIFSHPLGDNLLNELLCANAY